jgi:Holliday junction resolvase RusA-like endonuclease
MTPLTPADLRGTNGTVNLFLQTPPSANRWWRNVNGRMVTSKEAREYKKYVADQCLLHRVRLVPAPQPVAISITWFREQRSGDLDKRLGIALDALQGSAYDSDSQIVELHALRFEKTATHPPGIHVTLTVLNDD